MKSRYLTESARITDAYSSMYESGTNANDKLRTFADNTGTSYNNGNTNSVEKLRTFANNTGTGYNGGNANKSRTVKPSDRIHSVCDSVEKGSPSDVLRSTADVIRNVGGDYVSRELDMHKQIDKFENGGLSNPETIHQMHRDVDRGMSGDATARGMETVYNNGLKKKTGVDWSNVTNSPAAHYPFEKLNAGKYPTNREWARAYSAAADNIDREIMKKEVRKVNSINPKFSAAMGAPAAMALDGMKTTPDASYYNPEDHGGMSEDEYVNADFNDSTNESFDDDVETDSFEMDSVDSADESMKKAISVISGIAAKHGAKVGKAHEGHDGYATLSLVIEDRDKTPGVGYDMNYIMGVGRTIESEMKKAGVNGFVGAGGYCGCHTNIYVNEQQPFASEGIGESLKKKNFFDRATGFYDRPRSTKEISDEFNSLDKEPIIGYDSEGNPVYVHYNPKKNTLWANVDSDTVEIPFERDRNLDYNLYELYSKITDSPSMSRPFIESEGDEGSDDYEYFVIADYGNGWRIDSGWEYESDAKDRMSEYEIPRKGECRIKLVRRASLPRFGLDCGNDEDWMIGMP